MTTATQFKLAQRTEPVFSQFDLRYIHQAATRTLLGRRLSERLSRRLCRAELQLLAACAAIAEIIHGELGTDAEGDPVGDLRLKESPILPTNHQPRLGENGQ